jgi:hypothetical protein
MNSGCGRQTIVLCVKRLASLIVLLIFAARCYHSVADHHFADTTSGEHSLLAVFRLEPLARPSAPDNDDFGGAGFQKLFGEALVLREYRIVHIELFVSPPFASFVVHFEPLAKEVVKEMLVLGLREHRRQNANGECVELEALIRLAGRLQRRPMEEVGNFGAERAMWDLVEREVFRFGTDRNAFREVRKDLEDCRTWVTAFENVDQITAHC